MDQQMNGAETVARTLAASGARVCFANPGTSEMHLVAALDRHPEIRCILCLFEGGATGAADGYFRMTGEVAVTLLHLAPGFANGFANLHNARKGFSGVLNIMGEHATYHLRHDTPLKGNTEGISAAISHWTRVSDSAGSVAGDTAAALRAARAGGGQIATLILPADTAWNPAGAPAVAMRPTSEVAQPAGPAAVPMAGPPAARHRPSAVEIEAAARALRLPGAVLLLDGAALHGALADTAARVARATGAQLMAPNLLLVGRIRRGAGAVAIRPLSYRNDLNRTLLANVPVIVLCGANRPAGFFAYPGKPGVPESPDCRMVDLCPPEWDYPHTLQALAEVVGAADLPLGPQDRVALDLPPLPDPGPVTLQAIGQAIAALLPEDAVVVDEAISSSPPLQAATAGARGHDWLAVSGGAIGFGLPAAVGAAVACPGRKVVALEGDGSAMYTLQSLWTMAREGLDVTVVILANRGYQILRIEAENLGLAAGGRNARRMVDVEGPTLDWVALARGHGVDAVRVTDTGQFAAAFAGAMAQRGPFLIEVVC